MLLRFASEKFTLDERDLENNFIHLTNFTSDNAGEGEILEDYPDGVQVIRTDFQCSSRNEIGQQLF